MLYSKSLLVKYFKYSSLYMSILVALIFQPGALNTVLILDCVRDWRDPQGLANGGLEILFPCFIDILYFPHYLLCQASLVS